MGSVFARLVTAEALKEVAGARSFARGSEYFQRGAVLDVVDTGDAVKARVQGNDEYRVVLRGARGALAWSCTCPLGEDGEFCKHAVATGLAWLARREQDDEPPAACEDEIAEIRGFLGSQHKNELIALLLVLAESDSELRARLHGAALQRKPPPDLKTLKAAVRTALAVPNGFVDYRGMGTFITRARSVADLLGSLLQMKRAAEAVDLADYAMRRGIAAYEQTDDSSGGFCDTLRQIAALHLDACRTARPDAETLGAKLFALQMLDQWGFFDLESYLEVLGPKGLACYGALAEQAWRDVPERRPGAQRSASTKHFLVTQIMEVVARLAGDLDALIEVKSRDLSRSHRFLDIAQVLAKSGRHSEALDWAERARKAFPNDLHLPLAEFLVDAYRRRDRHAEAAQVAWEHFSRHPGLASYELLKKGAEAGGTWPEWREQALAHVRAGPKARAQRGAWHWSYGGRSLLVKIFLEEGDSDAALTEARAGGCSADLWIELARAREENHPQDAIAIYQARFDSIVEEKSNRAYDSAAQILSTIAALMRRTEREREFHDWLAAVRMRHKAKRSFMKRIERW